MIYVNVYNLNLEKKAILENAYDIVETQEINQVYSLEFKLPSTDGKNDYCQKFWYVRINDDGQLYRIISAKSEVDDKGTVTYYCEHVIATLIDDVIFGADTWGNLGVYTADSINHVLDKQTTKNWALGTCDFERQFEYSVENENLLSTLYSIANRLDTPYMWDFDTVSYPWKVSLKAIDETAIPEYYIRAKRNILKTSLESSSEEICTKLYCLGYGEGVNQLTIKDVNDGLPYLLASDDKIEKYGLKTKIFADTRYKDAQSLKERGEALLAGYSEEVQKQTFDVVDLYGLTNAEIDRASIGKIVKLAEDNTITYITKTKRKIDEDGDLEITLSTKADDIASTIADLSDRQRINEVYSQGSTQIFSFTMNENADSDHEAKMAVYIPSDMIYVNEVKMCVTLENYRMYHSGTDSSDGAAYSTTEGGECTVSTSSSGSSSLKSDYSGTSSLKGAGLGEVSSQAVLKNAYTIDNSKKWFSTEPVDLAIKSTGSTDGATASHSDVTVVSESVPTSGDCYEGADGETKKGITFTYKDSGPFETIHDNDKYTEGKHKHTLPGVYSSFGYPNSATSRYDTDKTDNEHAHVYWPPTWKKNYYTWGNADEAIQGETGTWTQKGVVADGEHTHWYYKTEISSASHHHLITELPQHTHTMADIVGASTWTSTNKSTGGSVSTDTSHTHQINISAHTHHFYLPVHNHTTLAGIYEYGNLADGAVICIDDDIATDADGNALTVESSASNTEIDLTSALLDDDGKVKRGWVNIGVLPVSESSDNAYAYIRATVFVRGFISSLVGSTY